MEGHALPESVRQFPWPSIQRDSQLLADRCALGLVERSMRERLEFWFQPIGSAA